MSNHQLVGSRILLGLFPAALFAVLGLAGCGNGNGGADESNAASTQNSTVHAMAEVAALPTQSYTTNFDLTENPISEGGAWHRAGNIWTNVRTANGIAFGTNGMNNTYDDAYALLSGFGPEQQAEAVVFRSPGLVASETTHEMELLLRFSDDAGNARGYECLFNYGGGVDIVRWNGAQGDFTPLAFTAGRGSLGRNLVSGDVIKATIVGNVISTYINGVLMAQAIDSTFANGQPGIAFFTRPEGVSANADFGMTSYTASGPITDPVIPPTPTPTPTPPPTGLSPDGTIITAPTGSLITTAGTWTFGLATSVGGNALLLNGQSAAGGFGTNLYVLNLGKVYTFTKDSKWYLWSGTGWSFQVAGPV
jgi:hypothetical protein